MRWGPEQDAEIVRLWRSGWSSLRIGRRLEVTAGAVRKRLRRCGVGKLDKIERSRRHIVYDVNTREQRGLSRSNRTLDTQCAPSEIS